MSCNPTTDTMGTPATGCESDPGGPKCAATFPDPQGGAVLQCEPAGTAAANAACTRQVDSSGNELAGVDSCIDGYCSALGVASGRQCARYCDGDTKATRCMSSQDCFEQAIGIDSHVYGLCRKTCDPFGAQSQCPQTNTAVAGVTAQVCNWSIQVSGTGKGMGTTLASFCSVTGGTVAAGGTCNPSATPTPTDCVAGQICLGDNTCHALCDSTHACGANQMCSPGIFGTNDTCDTTTGMGCPNACDPNNPNAVGCEACDMTMGTCILIATNANMGGWCVAMPDAGGLVRDIRRGNVRPLAWQQAGDVKGTKR